MALGTAYAGFGFHGTWCLALVGDPKPPCRLDLCRTVPVCGGVWILSRAEEARPFQGCLPTRLSDSVSVEVHGQHRLTF
jgi:hypothetical protein